MAGTFGRSRSRSRSRSKLQSGGSWGRSKAGSVKKNQKPTKKKCAVSSKAGRGEEQQEGSESGSSKESSATSSSSSEHSSKFKACRRRRRRGGRPRFYFSTITETPPLSPRPKFPCPVSISPTSTTSSTPTTTKSAILWRFRSRADSPATTKKAFFFSSSSSSPSSSTIISFFLRICKKNGANPSPGNDVVEIGDDEKRWWWGNRGSSRRPYCSIHRAQRSTQQSVHRERPKRSTSSSLGSHRHSILRRSRPARLRSAQQSRRLAHQESQSRHRRTRGAPSMEPQYFIFFSKPKFTATTRRARADKRREPQPQPQRHWWGPPWNGGTNCFL